MSEQNLTVATHNASMGFADAQSFELVQRAAKLLASSTLVPKEYQGNLANCAVALNIAARVGADPLMVMQNMTPIHGKPSWSSQFLIATVNTCGRFTALRFEFFGEKGTDEWGCRAWAIEKDTGEKLVGTDVTIAIAKKEGWFAKNGSKWQSMPQQMLMYRAGAWWTRIYAPELSMGLYTKEEMVDVYDATKEGDSYVVDTSTTSSAIAPKGKVRGAAAQKLTEEIPQGEVIEGESSTVVNETPLPLTTEKPPHDPETGELYDIPEHLR